MSKITFKSATGRLLSKTEIEEIIAGYQFRFRRPKRDPADEKGGGFERTPWFGIPIPYDSRPVARDGRVSHHFDHSTITKRRLPGGKSQSRSKKATKGNAAQGGNAKAGKGTAGEVQETKLSDFASDAVDHESYMTREEAVLVISPADYEKYIGRDGAVAHDLDKQRAIFSNISPDPHVRVGFWKAVTRCERNASPDKVTLYADRIPAAGWEAVRDMADAPEELRKAASQMAAYHELQLDSPLRASRRMATFELDRIDFDKVRRLLKRADAWERKKPPLTIKKGRGGRVQQRIVAELPVGLDIVAMLRVTQRYCDWLARKGVMYTAVIHAPDYHNDERNYHLHLAYYERPSRFLDEHQCWDFEYREPVPGQWNRFRYPERQNKIEELSRPPSDGEESPWDHRARQLFGLRGMFSILCNQELQNLGINRLLDPRRYDQMGIEQEPCEKLGPAGSALQAAGIPVAADIRNAERTYNRAFKQALDGNAERWRKRRLAREAAQEARDWIVGNGGDTRVVPRLDHLIETYDRLSLSLGNDEEDRDILLLVAKMACSRPKKTVEYCERLLAAIDDGTASRADQKMADLVQKRLQQAEDYIDAVDLTTEEYHELTDQADAIKQEVAKLESVVGEIGNMLQHVEASRLAEHIDGQIPAAQQLPVRPGERQSRDRKYRSVGAYLKSPLEYEENWNLVFDRINYENTPIKAPIPERGIGFHVPGISKQDLEFLLNPFFYKRSQARLQAIHIRRFKENPIEATKVVEVEIEDSTAGAAISPQERDAETELESVAKIASLPEPVTSKGPSASAVSPSSSDRPTSDLNPHVAPANAPARPISGFALEQDPLRDGPVIEEQQAGDRPSEAGGVGHTPQPADAPTTPKVDYDALLDVALRKNQAARELAVQDWMKELISSHNFDWLPAQRFENQISVDLTAAPDDIRKEAFASHPLVIARLEREEASRREDVLHLVRHSSKQLVLVVDGEARYDREDFPLGLRPFLADMFQHDPEIRAAIGERARRVSSELGVSSILIESDRRSEAKPKEQHTPGLTMEQLQKAFEDRTRGYGQ